VDFTKRRFLNFREAQQHKKCAQHLREIYNLMVANRDVSAMIDHYNEILGWINGDTIVNISLKKLIDRYHEHLAKAGVKHKEHNLLTQISKGDKAQGTEPWPIAIYLDHVRSAHNVGSIIRTIEALSLGRLYVSDKTPGASHKQVQDTSMQTYQWVECFEDASLHSLPKPVIVMETSPKAISIYDFIFPEIFTLVLGNEEYGCSDDTLTQADVLIQIPLRGRKNSLNVANAFAIAAAEISRQKNLKVINEKNE
jgi:tRNA G18 (ribose-2'-O)-methylase SpoU